MRNRKVRTAAWAFVLIVGCFSVAASTNPMLGHYSYALLDAPICTFNISQKIGVKADFSAIMQYAKEQARPGMTHADIHVALQKISPIAFDGGHDVEEIVMKMCSSPLNNPVFWAFYTPDDRLIKIERDSFP